MLSAVVTLALAVRACAAGVFPYPVHKKTLPNGLDIVVLETPEFKSVLSYNTMVLAGSGDESEPKHTGLAHLFEHILFRHRFEGLENGYNEAIDKLGAHNNAWTWFDITFYYPLTFASNLAPPKGPGFVELEASRFKGLAITEKIFKTEAGAVLGEYRKTASSPSFKLSERLLALLFPGHPYGHTTMGYYEDVVNMPSVYEAAMRFYDTYYRPNNCVVVAAGDVRAEDVFKKAALYYKDWKPQPVPRPAAELKTPDKEQREHVSWDADVAPLVWVGVRMPAFKPGSVDSAVMELLSELLVSPAAPLYKKLRYEKQTASELGFESGTQSFESVNPRVLIVRAQLYKERYAKDGQKYFDEVESDILRGLDELKGFSRQKDAAKLLEVVKSKYRYDFLASLSSPANIAATFAWYYRFDRDPNVLDKLLGSVAALKPEDVDRFASANFIPANRALLTLAYGNKTTH